jgi:hypothetical protein
MAREREKENKLRLAKITELPVTGLVKLFEVACPKSVNFEKKNDFVCSWKF